MSSNEPIRYSGGISVSQMKEFLANAPEFDDEGRPFILLVQTEGDDNYILPIEGILVEKTERRLADGSFGNQIILFTE